MTGYLEVKCNIIDHYVDEQVVEWYSIHFGGVMKPSMVPLVVAYRSALDPEGECRYI